MIFSHVLYQLSYLGGREARTRASQSGAVIGACSTPVQHTWRRAKGRAKQQSLKAGLLSYCGGRAEISFKSSLSLLIAAMSLHCALLRWVHSIVTL